MSALGPTMLLFSERITSLKSAAIYKIWMTVSNSGDFSMANLLGFLDTDLVLILKTTGMMNDNNSINKSNKWPERIGIPMEWNAWHYVMHGTNEEWWTNR